MGDEVKKFEVTAFCAPLHDNEDTITPLNYEQLVAFFNDSNPRFNDGSEKYKLNVVKKCFPDIPDSELESKIEDLFSKAIEKTPILKNTRPEFWLVKINYKETKKNQEELGTILIPRYKKNEIEAIIYNVWSKEEISPVNNYDENWKKEILARAIIANSDLCEFIEFDEPLLYEILTEFLPGFSENSAMEFIKNIRSDHLLELKYCMKPDGTFDLPISLKGISYETKEKPVRMIGRPDIDEIIRYDLESMIKLRAQLKKGEIPTVNLHNRIFVGDPGTGKTTAVKNFAYEALQNGFYVFDLGRGVDGNEENNPAAMMSKAFEQISALSKYLNEPVVVILDDRIDILRTTQNEDLGRDDLTSTLKRLIGGISDSPNMITYATGNPTSLDSAFFTPKRFGTPIITESTPETQAKMINANIEKYGLKEFPDENMLIESLKLMPPLSNELLICMLESAVEKGTPTFKGFSKEVANFLLGESQQQKISVLEMKHRNIYTAGILTMALALGEKPFAVKTEPTTDNDMPEVILSLRTDTRYGNIIQFLAYTAGLAALHSLGNKELLETPIIQAAEKEVSYLVKILVDNYGISRQGIDTLHSLRSNDYKPPLWAYEETQERGLYVGKVALKRNNALYQRVLSILETNHVLYEENIAEIDIGDIKKVEIPDELYKKTGPSLYHGNISSASIGFPSVADNSETECKK
jgi:hypothetical protein